MYGLIPRTIEDIFRHIMQVQESQEASVELSVQYIEIYLEKIRDLLCKPPKPEQDLKVSEMKNGQMVVKGAETRNCNTFDEVFRALEQGQRSRAVASTNQNDRSSRSHTIFVLNYLQKNRDGS